MNPKTLVLTAILMPPLLAVPGCKSKEEPSIIGIWKTPGVQEHFELTEDGDLVFHGRLSEEPRMTFSYELPSDGVLVWAYDQMDYAKQDPSRTEEIKARIEADPESRFSEDRFDYMFKDDPDKLIMKNQKTGGNRWKIYERVSR